MNAVNQIQGTALGSEKCSALAVEVPTVGENIKNRIKYHQEEARRLQVMYDGINGTPVLNMRMKELEKILCY
jgi:hypothetical protein